MFTWQMQTLLLAALISAASAISGEARETDIPRDEHAFTAFLAAAFWREMPSARVVVEGPYQLGILFPASTSEINIYLDNIDGACRRDVDGCDESVRSFVASMSAIMKEDAAPIERSSIRAVLRSSAYVEQIRQAAATSPDAEPIVRHFVGDLWVVGVADGPDGIKLIRSGDAVTLGLSPDEVMTLAKNNLAIALKPLDAVTHPLPARGFDTVAGEYYEVSRLLLHDEWASLAEQMQGALVVAVPAIDYLLYGDSGCKNAIPAMAAYADYVVAKAQRPISSTLLKWTETGWEMVRPEDQIPADRAPPRIATGALSACSARSAILMDQKKPARPERRRGEPSKPRHEPARNAEAKPSPEPAPSAASRDETILSRWNLLWSGFH